MALWVYIKHILEKLECVNRELRNKNQSVFWLTVVDGEESPGVVFLFSIFTRHIFAEEVEGLVSAMARNLLTANHLQQGEEDSFQVFGCICGDNRFVIHYDWYTRMR